MLEFIPYASNNGLSNMEIDLELFNSSISKGKANPILRLYGWDKPTLTIGRNQQILGINIEFCKQNNIDIVKRPTGGRALLHDNEITYSYIVPFSKLKKPDNIISSYKEISDKLIESFKFLDIELYIPKNKKAKTDFDYCMNLSTGADICYKDKKFIGSAQYRKDNYILQHGSILFDYDFDFLSNVFNNENIEKNFTTLKEINPEICKIETISNALKKGFESNLK